jgi:DNA-binding MarR family transcriptional regulator
LSQLLAITDLMRADMQSGLEERGLTQARAHLLWELGSNPPMTQRELADRLRVTPRNVTGLVDALEGSGFVRRAAHGTDRRAVVVTLTAAGATALAQLQADMQKLAEALFGAADAADLAAFVRVASAATQQLRSRAGS